MVIGCLKSVHPSKLAEPPSGTRSGKWTAEVREQQLQRDQEAREAEAANRRLRKAYTEAGCGPNTPPQQRPVEPTPPTEEEEDDDGAENSFATADGENDHQLEQLEEEEHAADTADQDAAAADELVAAAEVVHNVAAAMVIVNYDERGETATEKESADIMSKIGQIKVEWTDNPEELDF